jgi:hypothetical protein
MRLRLTLAFLLTLQPAFGTVDFGILAPGEHEIFTPGWGKLSLLKNQQGANGPWFTWSVLKPKLTKNQNSNNPLPPCTIMAVEN